MSEYCGEIIMSSKFLQGRHVLPGDIVSFGLAMGTDNETLFYNRMHFFEGYVCRFAMLEIDGERLAVVGDSNLIEKLVKMGFKY